MVMLTTTHKAEGRFAVLVNANARRVTSRVHARLQEIVPPEDLFLSRNLQDAHRAARLMVQRAYSNVFAGGGDGTVYQLIDMLLKRIDVENRWWSLTNRYEEESTEAPHRPPGVGVLKLGTGNGIAALTCSHHYLKDLEKFKCNPFSDSTRLGLIESHGTLFPFAGVGWDAELLNDYIALKQRLGQGPLKSVVENVGGYFAALFARFIPRHIAGLVKGRHYLVRVLNLGRVAERIGSNGKVLESLGRGEVLYEGPVSLAMVGTVPYYGYGMKVLPFADQRPNAMQLRIANLGVMRALGNLPAIWKGNYSSPHLHDFLVSHVELAFSEAVPSHICGDFAGLVDRVEYKLSDRSVRLLNFA